MKRLLLFYFLLSWTFTNGQVVQIGTGTDTAANSLLAPVYLSSATSQNNYFRSNILYDSVEVSTAGIPSGSWITSIAFYKYGNGGTTIDNSIDYGVYMANDRYIDSLPFRASWNDDILPNYSLVFKDTAFDVPNSSGWMTIPLQTPFQYTGGSLKIAFEGVFSGFGPFGTGTFDWQYTNGYGDYIIGGSSNYSLPSSLNAGAGNSRQRPNIRISYTFSACNLFADFSVDSITDEGFKLNWTPGASNSGFYLEYGASGFTPGSGTQISGSYPGNQPPVYITGLNENSNYDIYLNELCNSGADTAELHSPISVLTAPSCPAPEDVLPGFLGSDHIVLDIIAEADSFDYEIGPVGFKQGSGVLGKGGNPLQVGGLSSQTSYDIYIRSNCVADDDGHSFYKGPYTFTTGCAAQFLPYRENFNTDLGCMQVIDGGTTTDSWEHRFTTDWMTIDGSGYAFAEPTFSGIYREIMVTPELNASTLSGDLILEFDQVFATSNSDTSAWVQVYDGTSWINLMSLYSETGSTFPGSEAPDHQEINISAYANANLQVRFLIEGGRFWLVDNLKILDVTCYEPDNIAVNVISPTSVAIDFTNATAIQYEYDTVGYSPGSGTMGGGDHITGLTPDTDYDVYVRSDCSGAGDGYSEWAGPFTIRTYCSPSTVPFTESFEDNSASRECWSQSQILGDKVWTFASGTDGGSLDSAYSGSMNARFTRTFTGRPFITRLISPVVDISSATNPKLEFYYAQPSFGINHNYLNVYVRDTSFGAPWVRIYSDSAIVEEWTKGEIFFTTSGSQVQFAFEGIDNYGRANVIDSVRVFDGPPCPEPTQLAVHGLGEDSIVIGFNSGQSFFNYEYGPSGFTPGNGTQGSSSSNPVKITGLQSETTYDVYIQTDCSALNNGTSPWAGPLTFTTPCAVSTMLSGTYTIDQSQPTGGLNFNSFREVGEYLSSCGVSGPVVFNVQPGIYEDRLHIVNAPGISGTNTVIFNGGNHTTLSWDKSGAATSPVLIDSTGHITIKDMIIKNDSLHYSCTGVRIVNLSDSITIDNCEIAVLTDAAGVMVSSGYSFQSSDHNSNYITISNCWIKGGGTGIAIAGDSDYILGYKILNNRVEDFSSSGISGSDIKGLEVTANITNSTLAYSRGISMNDIVDFAIEGNKANTEGDAIGVYGGNDGVVVSQNSRIVNNMAISKTEDGFELSNMENVDIFHNTSKGERGVYVSNHVAVDMRNNIFTSPSGYAFSSRTAFTSDDVIDYNLYSGGNPAFEIAFTSYADLAAWKAADASHNVSSREGVPTFLGVNDLHIITSADASNNGDPTVGETIDIDGDSRSATTPDIGADEFEVSSCLPSTELKSANPTGSTIDLSWTAGSGTIFNILYGPRGFTPGSGNGTLISGVSNPHTLISLSPLTEYDYYVQDDCGGGETSRWSAVASFSTGCVNALSGVYTIDPSQVSGGTNFTSFTEFAGELNTCGVSGPVTVNIAPGTYDEHLYLKDFFASSAINTVSFNGGNQDSVILTSISSEDLPTVHIDGADYLIFKNMTISNTGDNDAWGVMLQNAADHIVIDSCKIEMPLAGGRDVVGIVSSNSLSSATSSGNNANYLTVSNSIIRGGQKGMRLTGGSNSESACLGHQILNNTFLMQTEVGVEADGIAQVLVHGNVVDSIQDSEGIGMDFTDIDNYDISSNKIATQGDAMIIDDSNYQLAVTRKSTVINNMLISKDGYGLYLDDIEQANFYQNSVVGRNALRINDAVNLDVRNNIFYATGGVVVESADALSPTDTIDYNIYYLGSGTNLAEIDDSTYADLASWRASDATLNVNSIEGDPGFVNPGGDLHISGATAIAYNSGDSLNVAVDIDGDPRSMQTPDIGADELFCGEASGLQFDNISCTSVILEWELDFPGSIVIEYDTAGFVQGTGNYVTGASPLFLPGLQANTDYDFYIANSCMSVDTTQFKGPYSLTTEGAPGASFSFTFGQATGINQVVDFDAGNTSGNVESYDWDFGDGTDSVDGGANISHTYTANGTYYVTLTANGGDCGDSSVTDTIVINEISLKESSLVRSLEIYPNPVSSMLNVRFMVDEGQSAIISISDISGKTVIRELKQNIQGSYEGRIDISSLAKGVYMLQIESGSIQVQRKIVRE